MGCVPSSNKQSYQKYFNLRLLTSPNKLIVYDNVRNDEWSIIIKFVRIGKKKHTQFKFQAGDTIIKNETKFSSNYIIFPKSIYASFRII